LPIFEAIFLTNMARVFLAAIFLSATLNLFGQAQVAETRRPYNSEHESIVTVLMQSFDLPVEPEETTDPAEEWETWTTVENFAFGKNRGAMAMITDVDALHPYFREKVLTLIEVCKTKGIDLAIVETYRTRAKQNEYRSMGRIYTRSGGGKSKHQYGLAIDVVPVVDSVAVWHDAALWKKIGSAGERLGLRWGGRWRHPYDPGHFEWSGGITSTALESGSMPRVPGNQYPCIEEDLSVLRTYWTEWEEQQSRLVQSRANTMK
jgi:hypothetical protein